MTETSGAKAIHLAAGEGTRLRPVTSDRPKPLVELGGVSLLERNVGTLRSCGVADQVVVTGYRADQIRKLGYETVHNPVYDQTDMVHSLFTARDQFPTDRDLLISYGDIIYERDVVESLLASDGPISVVVDREWQALWNARFDDPLDDAETLQIDEDGLIEEIGGVPEDSTDAEAQYVGLIKVRADAIDKFAKRYRRLTEKDEETYASVEMTHYLQSLIDEGWEIRSVPIEGGWLEVDTVEDLDLYRELYAQDKLSKFVDLRNG